MLCNFIFYYIYIYILIIHNENVAVKMFIKKENIFYYKILKNEMILKVYVFFFFCFNSFNSIISKQEFSDVFFLFI